jgi:hypothetical protein
MLVRNKPFGEWVTVYFDPDKITEETLLGLLKKKRCPKAATIRREGMDATVANPFVAPGDTVQVQVDPDRRTQLRGMSLPDGWKVAGHEEGGPAEGDLLIQVPPKAAQGETELKLQFPDRTVKVNVTVVRKM